MLSSQMRPPPQYRPSESKLLKNRFTVRRQRLGKGSSFLGIMIHDSNRIIDVGKKESCWGKSLQSGAVHS